MARKIMLVEGTDDEHVIKHICGSYRIAHLDEVKPQGGSDNLLRSLPAQIDVLDDDGDVLGIVIDADDSPEARWQSLRNIFTQAGYPNVPSQPDPDGTILESPEGTVLPRAGVWIMPDNRTPGILEDFLRFLVPDRQSALFAHAERSVATVPERRFSENDTPKAVIHTWLAWQEEPGKPYGTAITAEFMDSRLPQAQSLADWLERLFFFLFRNSHKSMFGKR